MRKLAALTLAGAGVVGAAIAVALVVAGRQPADPTDRVLSVFREGRDYGDLTIDYPLDETLFPPEIVPPTFRWRDSNKDADTWLVTVRFPDGDGPVNALCDAAEWRPADDQWKVIKNRSLGKTAKVFVLGFHRGAPEQILSGAAISIGTSTDPVGAPLFYREVVLPFIDAVKDPSRIRWRFGEISSPEQPPIVLEKLPVCGNCHSFSAAGTVLGMDVDYANSKGSYVILPVAEDMVIPTSRIITWDDYKKEENELSFGLLSQVSPDGKYVISTVKDRSVFVPKPGLVYSQLFFPIKGILAYYCRETKKFHALPGADDPRFVQSNPSWSPDGKYILFARSKAYTLKNLHDQKAVLLTREECREFLEGHQTFSYDLYRIPFNQGKGGAAEPLEGASQNGMSNYFARYSPDGKWIVFCKAKSFMLLQPDSQLYMIPAGGGKARRLRCNTPRMNSWHSWSPNSRWLVFSSKVNSAYTQLFLTHIDPQGRSTPAVLLSQFTAPDRAANIPEFVHTKPGAIKRIREQFLDDYSFLRAGNECMRHRDLEGAARAYAKAVELNPTNAEAHCNLGISLSDQGMLAEAEVQIRKAVELQPEDRDIRVNLGILLARQRKYREALPHYRKALEIDPRCIKARANLASALAELGEIDQAIDAYRKTLSVDPKYAHAHFELGRLLLRRSQLPEAERHFAAAIEIQPQVPGAYYCLGQVLVLRGEAAAGIEYFRQALELDPKFVDALNTLAWVYATHPDRRIRNGKQAVALAQRACHLTGEKVPAALDTLAAAYAEAGDFGNALRTAAKAKILAEQAGNAALAAQINNRLLLYSASRPFRAGSP
jgi:tetratricopeptide (TPR) repeat protein